MATHDDVAEESRPLYERRERVQAALVVVGYARDIEDRKELLKALGLMSLGRDWKEFLPEPQEELTLEERMFEILLPFPEWSLNTLREQLPDMVSRDVQNVLGEWRRDRVASIIGSEPSTDPKARGRKISRYQWVAVIEG